MPGVLSAQAALTVPWLCHISFLIVLEARSPKTKVSAELVSGEDPSRLVNSHLAVSLHGLPSGVTSSFCFVLFC